MHAGGHRPQTGDSPWESVPFWYDHVIETVLVISAVLALVGAVVFFAMMFWAAREDGRDQRARDAAADRDAVNRRRNSP
jgi:hypothetical protein